jgi:hypothetical protein
MQQPNMIVASSNRFFNWVNRFPVILFLALALLIRISLSYFFSLASEFIRHMAITKESPAFSSLTEEFFLVVAVCPLVETFLFQYLPFYFVKREMAGCIDYITGSPAFWLRTFIQLDLYIQYDVCWNTIRLRICQRGQGGERISLYCQASYVV